jgi:hypothetical protein
LSIPKLFFLKPDEQPRTHPVSCDLVVLLGDLEDELLALPHKPLQDQQIRCYGINISLPSKKNVQLLEVLYDFM